MNTGPNVTIEEWNLFKTPKYIGYFEMYGVRMYKEIKPTWFHRIMMKYFFGITWHNLKGEI